MSEWTEHWVHATGWAWIYSQISRTEKIKTGMVKNKYKKCVVCIFFVKTVSYMYTDIYIYIYRIYTILTCTNDKNLTVCIVSQFLCHFPGNHHAAASAVQLHACIASFDGFLTSGGTALLWVAKSRCISLLRWWQGVRVFCWVSKVGVVQVSWQLIMFTLRVAWLRWGFRCVPILVWLMPTRPPPTIIPTTTAIITAMVIPRGPAVTVPAWTPPRHRCKQRAGDGGELEMASMWQPDILQAARQKGNPKDNPRLKQHAKFDRPFSSSHPWFFAALGAFFVFFFCSCSNGWMAKEWRTQSMWAGAENQSGRQIPKRDRTTNPCRFANSKA